MRIRGFVLVTLFAITSASFGEAAVVRFNQGLDNGTTVTVDNASGWSQTVAGTLVLAADRSTQYDCPYGAPRKGLFRTGDRIFINQNYLAWFDLTAGTIGPGTSPSDGVGTHEWSRSGELAGFWSLNPATQLFRYFKTGPVSGCTNWAHNEFIPGSASPNNQRYWWDKFAPAIEHIVAMGPPGVYDPAKFFGFHYSQGVAGSLFTVVADGVEDAAGVHYRYTGRLGNAATPSSTTIPGGGYIEGELEYLCRSNDIISTFKFRPSVAIVTNNLSTWLWSAYAQDEDGTTTCDAGGGATDDWPPATYITGQPLWAFSGTNTLQKTWNGATFPPGNYVQMTLGPTCSNPHVNYNIQTTGPVGDGSYIRWGQASGLPLNMPRIQLINLGVPGSGTGTLANPKKVTFGVLTFGNETHDGTLGGGQIRFAAQSIGVEWWTMIFAMRTNF